MSIDSPQKRPGTNYIPGGSSDDKGEKFKDPLAGPGHTSSHYPFGKESISEDKGGPANQEGQDRRGYVLDDRGRNGGPIEDTTVAPDGTRRVKEISGPGSD